MITQAEALGWLNYANGKFWDFDGLYGKQCVDLFNFYYRQLTGVSPYARGYGVPGAKDLWYVATDVFTKIPDSSKLIPQPGDVLIYGRTWGKGYGHVEMVLYTSATGATVVGNNMSGDPSKVATSAYRTWAGMTGLIGVMRPNWSAGGATGMIIGTGDNWRWRFNRIHRQLVGNWDMGDDTWNAIKGQDAWKVVEGWSDHPNSNKLLELQVMGETAARDNWAGQIATLQAQLADAKKNVEAVLADNTASKAQLRDALARVVELENTPIIKEVPVYTHDEETKRMISSIYNYFVGQFKSFAKYIKK